MYGQVLIFQNAHPKRRYCKRHVSLGRSKRSARTHSYSREALQMSSVSPKHTLTGYARVLANSLSRRRCVLTPNFRYVFGRAMARFILVAISCIPQSKNSKIYDQGFVCQVADDTSLPMSVDEYFSSVARWSGIVKCAVLGPSHYCHSHDLTQSFCIRAA